MRRMRSFIPLTALLLAWPVVGQTGELAVEADFDNGNAVVRAIDQDARVVTVSPRQVRGARNIWWHLRLTGIEPGETVELRIVEFDPVAGEIHPVYSYDGRTWQRMDEPRTPHRQTFTQSSVWIARNVPYPYGDSLKLAERLEGRPRTEVLDLCRSEEDRAFKLLRFTDDESPDEGKKLIWVQARQHAFESHSSHVAKGLALWLTGDSPEAAELCRRAVVYVVPIMDVDSVAVGGAGKDQQPVDFNRCWGDDPHWNAVRAAIERIDREGRQRELVCFLDLHNPWYRDTHHWHLYGNERLQQNARGFGARFVAALEGSDAPNSWRNRFITRYSEGPDKAGMSKNFAVRRWLADSERGVSMTMETAHWKDNDGRFITRKGLHAYGAALGGAMLDLVRGSE
jgi:hypothetical protein